MNSLRFFLKPYGSDDDKGVGNLVLTFSLYLSLFGLIALFMLIDKHKAKGSKPKQHNGGIYIQGVFYTFTEPNLRYEKLKPKMYPSSTNGMNHLP